MKKINSIGYAHRILGAAALFLFVIPALLGLMGRVLHVPALWALGKGSAGVGVLIAACFLALLAVELHQDRKIEKRYGRIVKNSRIFIGDGIWECQACGSRTVKMEDRSCSVCGCKFSDGSDSMSNQGLKDLSQVSQTLFIPLRVRAEEALKPDPLFRDPKAAEIMAASETGDSVSNGGAISTHGILARTVVMDREVKGLLEENPRSTVINLGAGLDTRMNRVDNGTLRWVDLDLPEVMGLRRTFFPEQNRVQRIAKSVMDFTWMDEAAHDGEAVIIIAEGLLMYLPEEAVHALLRHLCAAFPGADFLFDTVHTAFVGKGVSSPFLWGLDKGEEILAVCPNLRLVQCWRTGDLLKKRQPVVLRLLNALPSTRRRSQILHVRFQGNQREG